MKFVCFSGGARRGETEDRAGALSSCRCTTNLVGNQNGVAFPPHRPSAIYLFLFFLDSSSSATRIRSSSS